MRKIEVKSGDRFGRLTIVKELEGYVFKSGEKKRVFLCMCDCGNELSTKLLYLRNGDTQSCGCLNIEKLKERFTSHGLVHHRLYNTWKHFKHRCYNPNDKGYKNYGGRGISVCKEWRTDFMAFYTWAMDNGYSDELTIDRIDNDGNYEPSNCRWATRQEQSINQRMQKNNTSGYTGIQYIKHINKWGAIISYKRKTYYIGYYTSIEEALQVRNEYIIKHGLPHKIQDFLEN